MHVAFNTTIVRAVGKTEDQKDVIKKVTANLEF